MAPAKYLWFPIIGSGNLWSYREPETSNTNWKIYNPTAKFVNDFWKPTTDIPGADDDVVFAGALNGYTPNTDCVVDKQTTVHSAEISHGYTSSVVLFNSLTISGSNPSSSISMDSPGEIRGTFFSNGTKNMRGSLILSGSSTFLWDSGTLNYVNVDAGPVGVTTAKIAIFANPGDVQAPRMDDAILNIRGGLLWKSQSITVGGDAKSPSSIHIYDTGAFTIEASDRAWGAQPELLNILNDGTVTTKVQRGSVVTLGGNYTTTNKTILQSGTLELLGLAEQTAGTFELRAETKVALSSQPFHVLAIRDGSISGSGMIDGNLVLGYDPNGKGGPIPAEPVISAVGANGNYGFIEVTGNFQMFGGKMLVNIGGPSRWQYDHISVIGYASVAGSVIGFLNPAHAELTVNSKIKYLDYAERKGTQDFSPTTPPPNWFYGKEDTYHWFQPDQLYKATTANIGGRLWADDEGLARGEFEDGVEGVLAGIAVDLLDEAGATVLASTVSDAYGHYEFDDLAAGMYQVAFARPTGRRFAPPHLAAPDLDSDPDPETGRVSVFLTDDVDDLDAGYVLNADPVAADDAAAAHKNTPVTGTVLGNDTDADDDDLTAAVGTGPDHGSLTLNPDGSFTYTPDTDWTGTDSFTYTVDDGFDGTDTATVTVEVSAAAAPTGAADSYTVAGGELVVDDVGGVLANDTGATAAVLVDGPAHGTLQLNADGSFVYTPDDDFVGTDSFTYLPTDADGPGLATTVSLAVTDHPPEAADDEAGTDEDTPVTVDVLANDDDVDSDPLTVVGFSDGLYGTVAAGANPGELVYTPAEDWSGTDWFVYVLDDGHGRFSYATVTVTVDPVNDAPVAVDDAATATQDTPVSIDVRANDTDTDGDTPSVTGVTQGAHGTVTYTATGVTYTPGSGYVGADSFTYTISDGHGGTATATVGVTVTPANPDPQAGDDSYTLHQGTTIDILAPGVLANDPSPNGFALTVTGYTQPVNAATGADIAGDTLTVLSGGRMQYRAGAGFVGVVTFTYTVSDGHGYTATHTVYLHVTNTPPVGAADAYTVAPGGVLQVTSTAAGVRGNDSDADADGLWVVLVSGPSKGQLWLSGNGTFTYRPNAGQTGTDTFVYRVFDGAQYSDPITVTLTIG